MTLWQRGWNYSKLRLSVFLYAICCLSNTNETEMESLICSQEYEDSGQLEDEVSDDCEGFGNASEALCNFWELCS